MILSAKLSYSIEEAASALGIGRTKLYELIGQHHLTTFKIGARTLIRRDVLEEYQESLAWDDVEQEAVSMAASGVYMLLTAGSVVYVGRSTMLRTRLATHRASGRAFDEARIIPCDASVSVWLEKELIRTLQPTQNLIRYERHAATAEKALRRGGLQ